MWLKYDNEYKEKAFLGALGRDQASIYNHSFWSKGILFAYSDKNIHKKTSGFFGLGIEDYEGSYGISNFNQLVQNNIIKKPVFSVCLSQSKGYLTLGQ